MWFLEASCVLEVGLENPKELREFDDDYPLTSDWIKIKNDMLFKFQLMIADFYNIPIGNAKELVPTWSRHQNQARCHKKFSRNTSKKSHINT